MMEEDRETCPNSSQEGMEVKHRKVLKEDQDEEEDSLVKEELLVEEKMGTVLGQVTIPYLVAGLGMVGAGLLLDKVQH